MTLPHPMSQKPRGGRPWVPDKQLLVGTGFVYARGRVGIPMQGSWTNFDHRGQGRPEPVMEVQKHQEPTEAVVTEDGIIVWRPGT